MEKMNELILDFFCRHLLFENHEKLASCSWVHFKLIGRAGLRLLGQVIKRMKMNSYLLFFPWIEVTLFFIRKVLTDCPLGFRFHVEI